LALILAVIVAVSAFFAAGLHRQLSWDSVRANLDHWLELVNQNRPLALLIFVIAYVAVTALSLPVATVLSLLAGALFGRWVGTAAVSVASTAGATLAFLGSRFLFQSLAERRLGGRLSTLRDGFERDGAYYLLTLRLIPLFPFFMVNLGMGLTRVRVTTYVLVSWLAMLPATFLYVNAGTALATLDSPDDILSTPVIVSLALLGLVPLVIRKLVRMNIRRRTAMRVVAIVLGVVVVGLVLRTTLRYRRADQMTVAVREFTNDEYPEDPALRSVHHGQYQNRRLKLIRRNANYFDFEFEPLAPHVARVTFHDVDVSLMTPSLPDWTRGDPGLRRIALTDRQWNRQQVRFDRSSPHVTITGGDGFEVANLHTAELAKNCLNAGLWEVLLFMRDGADKSLYYQGWFTFPLGHYRDLFEKNTGLPYWRHWYYLEHWVDPAGTPIELSKLRRVVDERASAVTCNWQERTIASGEQFRKRRTTMASNIVTWGDFYDGRKVRFATFIPPGRYSVRHPWKNEYRRIDRLQSAVVRDVITPIDDRPRQEIELMLASSRGGEEYRFLVSGFELAALPKLSIADYPKGLYMPMGIGVPPFFQSYDELVANPPHRSPYFSLLLDAGGRWIDHHSWAIDGPVLHRDAADPNLLHVYLLSYERHSLIAHAVIHVGERSVGPR
jgi:uncharacterized membrane protein YdjX (TVP38/TMEM64 family)